MIPPFAAYATPLAQVDPTKAIAEGLGANFLPYACALLVVALAFTVKYALDQNAKHALALETLNARHDVEFAALQAQLLATVRADAEEQRKLLLQVMPLSTKLVEILNLSHIKEG